MFSGEKEKSAFGKGKIERKEIHTAKNPIRKEVVRTRTEDDRGSGFDQIFPQRNRKQTETSKVGY